MALERRWTPTQAFNDAIVLVARVLAFVWFVPAAIGKIEGYHRTAAFMSAHGVPGELLPLVIATEIGCAVFLLVGWKTRLFAFLLAGYTILAVLIFHVPAANATDKIVQMAELVAGGGFLVLCAHGAGGWSLDALLARGRAGE